MFPQTDSFYGDKVDEILPTFHYQIASIVRFWESISLELALYNRLVELEQQRVVACNLKPAVPGRSGAGMKPCSSEPTAQYMRYEQ